MTLRIGTYDLSDEDGQVYINVYNVYSPPRESAELYDLYRTLTNEGRFYTSDKAYYKYIIVGDFNIYYLT